VSEIAAPDSLREEASRQDRLAIEKRRAGAFREADRHDWRACELRHQAMQMEGEATPTS
jgi:hypothetical protein